MSQLREDFVHLYQGNHGSAIKVGTRKEHRFAGEGEGFYGADEGWQQGRS